MADGITRIAVEGFKSIVNRQEIEIAPLTILAGANSSGKSSIMQPLLMLKQTLEAPYDPGALLLDGDSVKFTSHEQFLSKIPQAPSRFKIEIAQQRGMEFHLVFQKTSSGLQVVEQTTIGRNGIHTLRPNMTAEQIFAELKYPEILQLPELHVVQNRFFLVITGPALPVVSETEWVVPVLSTAVYVPGFRGTATRTYPSTAVGPSFPGTFDHYTASVILSWQKEQSRRYEDLNRDLRHLGLAESVFAHRVDDTAIELRMDNDMFSIADVGFGVSQTLPVLVALRASAEGQLVYLEEPEIHLHPRAQVKLADILADAAKRGVRVVAETHSTLLLTAIQTLVARGELKPDLVKLHWFQRDPKTGVTQVTPANLDDNGAFGDWPEDFDDVILKAESAYLDAVEGRQVR